MKRSVSGNGRRLEYILIRSRRRDVLFKALPGGETRVYAPAYLPLREADALVRERMDALLRMHDQLERQLAQNRLRHPVAQGSRICIEGRAYALERAQGKHVALRLEGERCILTLPEPEDENAVRAALKQALSRRALTRIRERLGEYAPRLGVEFGRVAIRDQKSRWGSCSAKHNLNFNWKLIMAPPEALDYVVIHELCHLIEFNHSPRFWRLVEAQMPEYEAWKKWLKAHGAELGVE